MRVAIITESFPPDVNGVAHCVLRVAELLASPVILGAHGAAVARRLGLPTVAVYQTDLPSYARAYRLGRAGEAFAWRWLRSIHNGAARTLAPSTVTATGLLGPG